MLIQNISGRSAVQTSTLEDLLLCLALDLAGVLGLLLFLGAGVLVPAFLLPFFLCNLDAALPLILAAV